VNFINCTNLYKAFSSSQTGELTALQDLSFCVEPQEILCIIGPSGCGKSTLLRLVAGLITPDQGQITFSTGSPDTAMVFQDHSLFPWMTVLDNAAFGLKMKGLPRQKRSEQAMHYLAKFGLAEFATSYPHELSGGMQQRVAIARAFATSAPLLLMDEPFRSLDAQTKLILQMELLQIWKDDQKTILFVTHDIDEAILLADRLLVMTGRPGRIREEIHIPFKRPRDFSAEDQAEAAGIKWQVWKMLEDEVRAALAAR
jgi:NitT/TauT family transport system ATP-binding protein